jgi:hypothetical protein
MCGLFALAVHGANYLAAVAYKLAPQMSAAGQAKPVPGAPSPTPLIGKAAMNVPQTRSEEAVTLAQGWWGPRGSSSYWRGGSSWRERSRDFGFWRWSENDEDEPSHSENRGTYRTLCVRLCDGFYWPISYATTPAHFDRDRRKCESSCGSPVRLHLYRNPGGEIDDMEDLSGRPYRRLKTAYLYRTEYNESCKCKSDPWEQEATDRHRAYVLEAAKRKGDKIAAQELDALNAAREAARRQAEATARTIAATEKQAASLSEMPAQGPDPQTKIDDLAERTSRRNERMSLGAGSPAPTAKSSGPPARYWRDRSDNAP